MTQRTLVAVAIMLVGASIALTAHHALHSEFDTSKRGKFRGTLTRFALINPHVRWFFEEHKPDGKIVKWEMTGAGPQSIRANGLSRIFKPGDTYDVTFAPARDGSNLGRIVTMTFPDGRVVTLFHEDPNNPNDK